MKSKKMKMGKYISLAISTLIVFVVTWIVCSSIYTYNSMLETIFNKFAWQNLAYIALGIIMIITFVSISIGTLSYSIKGFKKSIKKNEQEKKIWKLITLIFRIGMLIFASTIFILCLIWVIFMIKDAFIGNNMMKHLNFINRCGLTSMYYLSGSHSSNGNFEGIGLNANMFGILITSFVFILLWSAAGIGFEIFRRIFGGYKPRNNDDEDDKKDNTAEIAAKKREIEKLEEKIKIKELERQIKTLEESLKEK